MLKKSIHRNIMPLFNKIKSDDKFYKLSSFARYLIYTMIIEQDDEGKLPGSIRHFVSTVSEDRETPFETFEEALKELEQNDFIIYEKEKVVQINKKYWPLIPHTKRKSSLPDLSNGTQLFLSEDREKLERLMSALERLYINTDDKSIEVWREQQVIKDCSLGVEEESTLLSLKEHLLYPYYTNSYISFKGLVYSLLVYSSKKYNNLQKVIEIYKIVHDPQIIDYKENEHKSWNKLNYARFAATANKLMQVCSDISELMGIILLSQKYFEEELGGMTWTLETIFKRFPDIRKYHGEKIKDMWVESYAKEIQPTEEEHPEPEKELTGKELEEKEKEVKKKMDALLKKLGKDKGV